MPIKIEGDLDDATDEFRKEAVRHLLALAERVGAGDLVINHVSIEEDTLTYSGNRVTRIFLTLRPETAPAAPDRAAFEAHQAELDARVEEARRNTPLPDRKHE